MIGETTIFHVKVWNHPIETTISTCFLRVRGLSCLASFQYTSHLSHLWMTLLLFLLLIQMLFFVGFFTFPPWNFEEHQGVFFVPMFFGEVVKFEKELG